jgi:CrcB protein
MRERSPAQVLRVDSDLDLRAARHRRELPRAPWAVLGVISLGGGAGGLARYGLGLWLPAGPGGFPWATFAANLSGCLLIGVLMVLVSEVWSHQPLLRPFLGVGVLGGYTTFSVHMVETQQLLAHPAAGIAALYLAGTGVAALAAVAAGIATTRRVIRRRPRSRTAGEEEQ